VRRSEQKGARRMIPITFTFSGKKIGHKLTPGTYTAIMSKSRFNRAGNLEITLTEVKPATTKDLL